ncbi:MAG: LysR family transcriptional regulator [Catonella sp.]|uniref:LysR family transcriptional regulator n=1 Tax=Catonella sp. TaxID=2382125 RepID=UPI003FA185B5
MDINHELYKVFYHVAKTLSFSEASKELFISQSAVSQSIKVLEKRLGQKLFIRSTKKVRLTKEGEILFSHIEPAINLINLGETRILESKSLNGGQLSIGASDTICRYYLKPFLKEFHNKYPNVHIKVVNGTSLKCVEYLQNGTVDIIVVNTPNSALGQVGKIVPVKEFRDVFVANRKAFPKFLNGVQSLEELQKCPMMMLDKASTTSEFLHKLFLERHLELIPEIELASNDLLIDLARIGLGIACVPDYCIDEVNEKELFIVKMIDSLPERGIAACYNDMGQTAESVFQFLNLLKNR